MKNVLLIGGVFALVLLTAACADPNPTAETGHLAGFWNGLWHGFILPFAFFISLFKDDVTIYEAYNNGGWYNFGFFLGAAVIFGGSGSSASRS